jgi:translation initiation factor 2 alpha subunit (eIF-2alpha)
LYIRVVYEFKSEYKNEITCEELLNIVKQYVEMKFIVEKDHKLLENTSELYTRIKHFYETHIANYNSTSRDNTDKLKEAKMKDQEVNTYFENMFTKLTKHINELQLDLQPTISEKDIVEKLGAIMDLDLDDENVQMQLKLTHFENTNYKVYYDKRFTDEKKIILEKPSLGNLIFCNERIQENNDFMLSMIESINNLTKQSSEECNE